MEAGQIVFFVDKHRIFSEHCGKNRTFAVMETKEQSPIEKAESIENLCLVNHVDSGLPRWLIEAAFVCYLLQAVVNYAPLMHWLDETHLSWVRGIVQTFGAVVMYFGLLRGTKPLYRPFTAWWWVVIALNLVGFVTASAGGHLDGALYPDFQYYSCRLLPACWPRIGFGQPAYGDSHHCRHCHLCLDAAAGVNLKFVAFLDMRHSPFPAGIAMA